MSATITFFPVGNGDMTLLTLENGRRVLIDCNIRESSTNPSDGAPDVLKMLYERLPRDSSGRPYVDVFLLSHPDQDHCNGLQTCFHLGPPDEHKDQKKIGIRELWSSPIIFRRASKNHALCEDAKHFRREAKRRLEACRSSKTRDGDRLLIIGHDENGKTDHLGSLVVTQGDVINRICGFGAQPLRARVLGPLPVDVSHESQKNSSSVVLNLAVTVNGTAAASFLTGGDAGVEIWEELASRTPDSFLRYDILQTPHHCSWRSLSYDSWSELGESVRPSSQALAALGKANPGAIVVSSSEPIRDNDNDPPCIRAKREYVSLTQQVQGEFYCTAEYPRESAPRALDFLIDSHGPRRKQLTSGSFSGGVLGKEPLPHGQ